MIVQNPFGIFGVEGAPKGCSQLVVAYLSILAIPWSVGTCEESYFDNRLLFIDGSAGWYLDGIAFHYEEA